MNEAGGAAATVFFFFRFLFGPLLKLLGLQKDLKVLPSFRDDEGTTHLQIKVANIGPPVRVESLRFVRKMYGDELHLIGTAEGDTISRDIEVRKTLERGGEPWIYQNAISAEDIAESVFTKIAVRDATDKWHKASWRQLKTFNKKPPTIEKMLDQKSEHPSYYGRI